MVVLSYSLKLISLVNRSIMTHLTSEVYSSVASFQYPATEKLINSAAESLLCGRIIAVPTDTVYGIAALAQNTNAVRMMYRIKKRNPLKPVAVCVANVSDIPRWGKVTIPRKLLHSLLPGPVTLVFERTNELNPELNPESSLVGIRIPDHGLLQSIVNKVDRPLALTSANISSTQSPLEIQEFEHLWPQLDLVIDGGKLGCTAESREGSTVVDLSKVGHFKIIRRGSAYEATRKILCQYNLTEINE